MNTKQQIVLVTQPDPNDVVSAVSQGYSWGIEVLIFGTAALLAASLVAWLIHRS